MNTIDRLRARLRRQLRAPIANAIRLRERRNNLGFEHSLAVCAIFRDEAPFLDEWIRFHIGVGATHFYLYNNFSSDDFGTPLRPWITCGIVTLTDWPVPVGQIAAYSHCLKRARRSCRWLAFLDIDEFLFSPLSTNILSILDNYADLPGIEVWEAIFGSSGHLTRPPLPVTEAYRKRAPLSHTSVKSIVNPRMVYKVGIHQSKYWAGEGLDTTRQRVGKERQPVLDVLRINHYWSRSIDDLETKIARNDASTPMPRDHSWHFNFEKSLNAEIDESILPIARNIVHGIVGR